MQQSAFLQTPDSEINPLSVVLVVTASIQLAASCLKQGGLTTDASSLSPSARKIVAGLSLHGLSVGDWIRFRRLLGFAVSSSSGSPLKDRVRLYPAAPV